MCVHASVVIVPIIDHIDYVNVYVVYMIYVPIKATSGQFIAIRKF